MSWAFIKCLTFLLEGAFIRGNTVTSVKNSQNNKTVVLFVTSGRKKLFSLSCLVNFDHTLLICPT